MDEMPSDSSTVVHAVSAAFDGVTLGNGISIRQSKVIERYGTGVSDRDFARIPLQEITGDWSRIPLEELECACVAHLDSEGYRYYIPALMLSVLRRYDTSSMRVIGTISSLYPKKDMWAYHMGQYAALNSDQLQAIASYVNALPLLL